MNTKLELCFKYTVKEPYENKNDPLFKLLVKSDEINEINKFSENSENKENKKEIKKFLYFNKKNVHQLLYDSNEVYEIKSDEEIILSELFYLSLLVLDDPETLNYAYPFDYIKTIFNKYKNDTNLKKVEKIVISKIILTLIFNFKGEDIYDENDDKEEIEELEKENKQIIEENLDIFNELNIKYDFKDIYTKKIDEIYLEIISSLIKENKFEDYGYCYDLITQLDLENIYITKTIFEGLDKVLNSGEDYINKYIINDILNQKNIDFYYILIKYIFKNSIYIYRNNFLSTNIAKIRKLIKSNNQEINNSNLFLDNSLALKLKEIINDDYLYYKFIYKENEKVQNQMYSHSLNSYCNQGRNNCDQGKLYNQSINKSSTIHGDENPLLKISYQKANEILKGLKFKIQFFPYDGNQDIKFIYKDIIYGEKSEKLENIKQLKIHANYDLINEEDLKNPNAEIVYKNYKRLVKFIEDIEKYINEIEIQFNPQIELELKREEKKINVYMNENKDIYNMTCISTFYNQINENTKMTYKDENILVYSIDGKSQGFINLINELSNEDYKNEIFKYQE